MLPSRKTLRLNREILRGPWAPRMTRSVFRNLALLLALSFLGTAALAPTVSAIPPPTEDCADVRPDVIACGVAHVTFPGVGSGTGAATGIVDWQLVVRTHSGTGQSDVVSAPAASLVAVGPSRTTDCATAYLYADGVEVARSETLCWII